MATSLQILRPQQLLVDAVAQKLGGHKEATVGIAVVRCETAQLVMQRIADRAVERGLHVVQLLDPLIPERIAHVLIPAHGIAICTAQHAEGAKQLFDTADDREQGFDRNACELLWQRAVEQLTAAKNLHDELEAFYVQNMDFDSWQGVLDALIARLP